MGSITYIGLAYGTLAAANELVDATPMEGFDNAALDALLELNTKGLKSTAILALGYRDLKTDWLLKLQKVRAPVQELVTTLE